VSRSRVRWGESEQGRSDPAPHRVESFDGAEGLPGATVAADATKKKKRRRNAGGRVVMAEFLKIKSEDNPTFSCLRSFAATRGEGPKGGGLP